MKKTGLLVLILLMTAVMWAQPGIPHNALIQINGVTNVEPAVGDIAFYGWIVGEETNVLYFNIAGQTNAGSWVYAQTGQGYGMCVAQIATYTTVYGFSWSPGDVFHIEIEELSSGATGSGELTLSNADFDIFAPPIQLTTGNPDLPAAPQLQTPANGAIDVMNPVNLTWIAGTGGGAVDGYNLYWGDQANPVVNGTMVDVGNVTTYALPNLSEDGTTYYWTVEAYNTFGNSNIPGARNFTMYEPPQNPSEPVLLTPTDGAVDLTNPVTLTWQDGTGGTGPTEGYYVFFGSNPDPFNNGTMLDMGTATSYAMPDITENGTVIYWTVQAYNSMRDLSTVPTPFSFTMLDAPDPPAQPILISPANNAFDLNNPITLEWQMGTGGQGPTDGYNVFYGMDSDPYANGTEVNVGNVTTWTMPDLPMDGATWYWTVQAWNNEPAESTVPNARHFSTWDAPDPPAEPVLVSPANGAVDETNPVAVTWQEGTGGPGATEGYNLYWGNAPDPYNNGTQVDVGNVLTYNIPNQPQDGTMVYWTVQAYNSERAVSTVPAAWNYTMWDEPLPPAEPVLLAPADGSVDLMNPVTLEWQEGTGGAGPTDGYFLYYGTDPDPYNNGTEMDMGDDTSYVLPDMPTEGATYYWTVKAYNDEPAESTVPDAYAFTMFDAPPAPVENLEWDYNSDTGIVSLTWEAPGGGGGDDSFFSGFEGNDLSDWGEFIQGPGTPGETGNAYWYIDNAPMTPYQGQCVRADWGYNIDTWLITPELAITADTEISFAWFSSYYWSVDPNDNSDLFVQVSTDGGSTWEYIWTYGEIGVWENFTWYETVLQDELASYIGQTVLIGWNLNGNDNSENALDECYVGPATGRAAGTHAMHQSQWAGDIARVSPQTTPQAPVVTMTRELLGYKIVVDNSNDGETILEELWQDTEYEDEPALGENVYTVIAVYDEGESAGVSTDVINVVGTGEGDAPGLVTQLGNNYPNPFNPETSIGFSLSQTENVVIDVYNLRGQRIRSLVNQSMPAGEHQVVWSGTDNNGKTVPSGMYLFKMKAGRYTSTKKMILLK